MSRTGVKDAHRFSLEFNMANPLHKKAWEYLTAMDRKRFGSYTNATATALVDYFDRFYCQQEDSYLESREWEERFAKRMVEAVSREIAQSMPLVIAGCMATLSAVLPASGITAAEAPNITNNGGKVQETADEPEEADVSWEYLGE